MCYNRSRNLLADYGGKLIATHLNDNLGISDYDGKIYWTDDLHLLPFDGIADWPELAVRLRKCGFDGPLTFELNKSSKPDRYDNSMYEKMPAAEYIAAADRGRTLAAAFPRRRDSDGAGRSGSDGATGPRLAREADAAH